MKKLLCLWRLESICRVVIVFSDAAFYIYKSFPNCTTPSSLKLPKLPLGKYTVRLQMQQKVCYLSKCSHWGKEVVRNKYCSKYSPFESPADVFNFLIMPWVQHPTQEQIYQLNRAKLLSNRTSTVTYSWSAKICWDDHQQQDIPNSYMMHQMLHGTFLPNQFCFGLHQCHLPLRAFSNNAATLTYRTHMACTRP